MRATQRCPKCNRQEILYLPRLTDFQSSSLAAYVSDSEWEQTGTLKVLGEIEAFVCRRCGYTELFTRSPDEIPVDEIPGARILTTESPYR